MRNASGRSFANRVSVANSQKDSHGWRDAYCQRALDLMRGASPPVEARLPFKAPFESRN
jgi:hypothetical protein